MAIDRGRVRAITVGDLLDPDQHDLRIPAYQRPYSWQPSTALQLVDDLQDAAHDGADRGGAPYVLGAVILHEERGHRRLDVVDGQQRLLTLRMILLLLDGEWLSKRPTTGDSPVSLVWTALTRRLGLLSDAERRDLATFVRGRCELVRVVTDDADEAFRVFDSQNYRGKPLAPHDLLKAHHLREMRDETPAMKAAVVETWESVRDEDLDRLFSTYLYRIACWSRDLRASAFTAQQIGMFKGISTASSKLTPADRYHLAAQAALPVLSSWVPGGVDDREVGRSRFQLDAPLRAGRTFFEMVTFLLEELERLVTQAYPEQLARFCPYQLRALEKEGVLYERPAKSRYRYVGELYLAALLYYTNRFGEADLDAAREQLFAWAYAPRAEMLRVQYRTVDNRGRGGGASGSAFTLMRNAPSGRVLNQLPPVGDPYRADHEPELVTILKGRP